MAIFHMSFSNISAGKGRSAIASAAYRSDEKLFDDKEGRHYFYARSVLPENEPAKQRALFFPMHIGQSKRLVCTTQDLINTYHQTHAIPLMDRISWDPVKSPHAIITGVSGSGKSYAMQTLYSVCNEIGKVIVIDPKVSNLARLTKSKPAVKVIIPDFTNSNQQGTNNSNI